MTDLFFGTPIEISYQNIFGFISYHWKELQPSQGDHNKRMRTTSPKTEMEKLLIFHIKVTFSSQSVKEKKSHINVDINSMSEKS